MQNQNPNNSKRMAKISTRIWMLVAGVVLAIGAAALPAAARSVAATSGVAIPSYDIGCFTEFYGSYKNNCSDVKILRFSLPVDNTGYKSVTVSAEGAGPSSTVGCAAYGLDPHLTGFWWSGVHYLSAFGSAQFINLSGAYITAGGVLIVNCWVHPGGRVNTINWDL